MTSIMDLMTKAELFAELRRQKALIVHCSRPGKGDEEIVGIFYPEDLKCANVSCARGADLSCSVIWPSHLKTYGAIGIVLKPRSIRSITAICPHDAGTHVDEATGRRVGTGVSFCGQAVRDTFANMTSYNEWNVAYADTIGIFVHPSDSWDVACLMKLSDVPGYDPSMSDGTIIGTVTHTLPKIMADFPGKPVYSFRDGEIVRVELDGHELRYHAIDPMELYP